MEYWAGQARLNFHELDGKIGSHFQVSPAAVEEGGDSTIVLEMLTLCQTVRQSI